MNLYGISSLLTAITSVAIGSFVFVKGPKSRTNKIWFILTLSIAVYGFGAYMVSISNNSQTALFWWQVSYIGIIMIPVLFLHFVCSFLDVDRHVLLRVIYFISLILGMLNILRRDIFLGNVVLFFTDSKLFKPGYWIYPPSSWLVFFIFFVFSGTAIVAHIELIKGYRRVNIIKRNQIKYFFLGTSLGFIGGGTSFLPCFSIGLYPILNIAIIVYPIITSYAIIKYRLMDISVAVTRTGIFIAVYTLVLGVPFALAILAKGWLIEMFGAAWWMIPLILMAALATVGPFIYIFLQRRAEDRLLKDQRRYQETLKQASVGMTRIRNLKRLLSLIAHIVTKTVRISYAAIYLYNKETNEFFLQVSRDKHRISLPKLDGANPLINWLSINREPLIYEEVRRQFEDSGDEAFKKLEENMNLLTASVIIPSFLEDRFMGFIVLGDKISGQIYTVDDLNVFRVLASQAALAIENAQFYEETKEMQQQVAQAEKMATVGTMADGLSHQINNRFYALSLIAGDTLDTINTVDTSKCTPEIKEMIKQIDHALKRIQVNVMQGGEVVKGILKYTRKGEEKFEALSLDRILDDTLEMVKYKVKLEEIDIVRNYPGNIPRIKGNMVQLQEVFFNLVDNAYDATVERKETLKEPGYRGRITINAQPKDDRLEIIIEDNGMGVKETDYKKLFTPFFTTKTSARKGTGLGLYVIQRIVTDTHKGTISFESRHKAGSRFLIELPAVK